MNGLKINPDDLAFGFIVEEIVCGISGFHAECNRCRDWRCHRQAHDTAEQAQACFSRHAERKHGMR